MTSPGCASTRRSGSPVNTQKDFVVPCRYREFKPPATPYLSDRPAVDNNMIGTKYIARAALFPRQYEQRTCMVTCYAQLAVPPFLTVPITSDAGVPPQSLCPRACEVAPARADG